MSNDKPTVVTLCGSTRFSEAFQDANLRETLAGRIVLSIGCDMRSDAEIFTNMSEEELAEVKRDLDELHKRKIDISDEILVLDVGGYVGESAMSEIVYAARAKKRIRYLIKPSWERSVRIAKAIQSSIADELMLCIEIDDESSHAGE